MLTLWDLLDPLLSKLVAPQKPRVLPPAPAPRAAPDPAEFAELREAVHWLTGDLAELQESVDFTQRLLAKQPQGGRLGGGS